MEKNISRILASRKNFNIFSQFIQKRNKSDISKVNFEKQIQELNERNQLALREKWDERSSFKILQRRYKKEHSINNMADLTKRLQDWGNFPNTFVGILQYAMEKLEAQEIISQTFLPEREGILKPDLAAAHFIVQRGGAVQFIGQNYWIGVKEVRKSLPAKYVVGLWVQAIKCDGITLHYEGLENMRKLKYLQSLSLKGTKTVNDWYLDWISGEYYKTLKHLDISFCTEVTYRGFSCFYRFQCLKTLNVEGIPESPELKLTLLMLLDIMPELEIKGIDLTVPPKIEPFDSQKQLKEPQLSLEA